MCRGGSVGGGRPHGEAGHLQTRDDPDFAEYRIAQPEALLCAVRRLLADALRRKEQREGALLASKSSRNSRA